MMRSFSWSLMWSLWRAGWRMRWWASAGARRRQARAPAPLLALVGLMLILALGAFHVALPARGIAGGTGTGVAVAWGDSTVLATWAAYPGAAGYRASLVRQSDLGIMEQATLPATQLAWDGQGIWPGESYFVGIQPLDGAGNVLDTEVSATGQSVPISRSTYNGFFDTEGRPAGQIDTNLWDEHIFNNALFYGNTFVNGQLHYHLQAGCPVGTGCFNEQTLTLQRARVPIDWTGRTATIHGEVDLKGDAHQWFGAVLSPQMVGPDRVLDEVDRFFHPRAMPQLELFTFEGRTRLLYAAGDGSNPQELASVPNPRGFNNVRDEIVWHVSTTHTTVLINGQVAFDLNWPAPLTFTHGYLSLFAEDYPNSGGTNGQPACDVAPTGDCSVWHLDNWGFDAGSASAVQPASAAYYAQGCGPYAGADGVMQQGVSCSPQEIQPNGSSSWSVPNVSTANATEAHVVFDVARWGSGPLSVAVNGHAAVATPFLEPNINVYNVQSYLVTVPASDLVSGTNTVALQLGGNGGIGAANVSNVQIETLSSAAYSPPPLPPEPAPIGQWGPPGPPSPSPSPSPTTPPSPSPTPTPIPIQNVPCVVTLNGSQQAGTCSGSFTPGS